MPIIDEVIIKKGSSRPVLVEFQNGKIKSGEEHNLESALFKTKENTTVVGIENNNMVYAGAINNETELYNNLILIHDRRTGKIRLIQVDCCTVCPVLDKKVELDTSVRPAENSISELNKQFGSKRTKRYTEQQERLKMNINTVKDQLEKTVSDIHMDETDLNYSTPNENDSLYRPKINREASTIGQVYKLDGLVPMHVLESLNDHALNVMDGNVEEYGLTSFSSRNISRLLESSSETKCLKVQIFLYINYLIKFINTPMKQITRKFVACDKSVEVNAHILDNYSINTGHTSDLGFYEIDETKDNRSLEIDAELWMEFSPFGECFCPLRTRPLLMKDKAICFILVLAAIAMDYEVDVESLSKDLKTGLKKVMEISRVLAFSSSSKNKTMIVLKLPLPPPVSSSPRKRR